MTDNAFLVENGLDLRIEIDGTLAGRHKCHHCQDHNQANDR
jgi:hypothetical protein